MKSEVDMSKFFDKTHVINNWTRAFCVLGSGSGISFEYLLEMQYMYIYGVLVSFAVLYIGVSFLHILKDQHMKRVHQEYLFYNITEYRN
jgi:hypothetical protein